MRSQTHILNRQGMRGTETSETETANPTFRNLRIVRYYQHDGSTKD